MRQSTEKISWLTIWRIQQPATQTINKENPNEKPTTNKTKYAKPRGNARKRHKRVKYIFGFAKIVKYLVKN